MVLKSVVIDDELMARKSIEHMCGKSQSIELVEVFDDSTTGLSYLEKHEIDLLFLDVEMPNMTGLELLGRLPVLPQVILTTSKKEYAFDAFEYEVTDFLNKPFLFPRFLKAVEKAKEAMIKMASFASRSAASEIYIRTEGRLVRLPFSDILYFENVGDYVKVHTKTGSHIIHGALKSIAARLDGARMLKVHRSFIVNMDHIVDIEDSTIVIRDKVIPVSRSHKPALLKSLNLL